MSTILLEVRSLGTFDGVTFRAPNAFTYTRVGDNHYRAQVLNVGGVSALGIIDPRGMLAELELPPPPPSDDLPLAPGGAVDVDACRAQNNQRITDLQLVRSLISFAGAISYRQFTGMPITPPDDEQMTPPARVITGGRAFGGVGFVSADAAVSAGPVSRPTDELLVLFNSAGFGVTPAEAFLWLLPIYSCGDWSKVVQVNRTGP